MIGGRNLLLLGGAVAAASCTTSHRVEVRAIPRPGVTSKTGDGLLGQARGQLALGDVGLALENLRTLQREQPENPDVFESIAQCYAAMSRYDLVRTNLEFALAYSPNDPRLLGELAAALDQQGEREQAMQVRAEAARLLAARAAHAAAAQAAVTPMGVPRADSVTVKLPAPVVRAAAATPSASRVNDKPLPRIEAREVPVNIAIAPAAVRPQPSLAELKLPEVSVEATAEAPPPRPKPAPSSVAATPVAIDDRLSPHRAVEAAVPDGVPQSGPYLERTGRGEVALITTVPSAPAQRPATPAREPTRAVLAMRVQWVPLKNASETQNVELLNAARSPGLAARTRVALQDRGWRKIAIGNASKVRERSLVLYGAARGQIAQRLATQFHCATARVPGLRNVVVLLGRDAAAHRSARA